MQEGGEYMIYTSAIEQIKGAQASARNSTPMIPVFRLGKVTSLSSGRAYIQFYGESSPSSKLYPYIEGYKPTVGDEVLLFQQGSTFIIGGKISKSNIGDNYYLFKSSADALYLTQAVADERYEPKGSGTDPRVVRYGNSYFGFGSSSSYVIGYASNTGARLDFGTSTNHLGNGYFEGLGANSENGAVQTVNAYALKVFGSITVNRNNYTNLGTSNAQLNNVYAKQYYQNGTAISTSDRRKKTGIKEIGRKYIEFFKKLKPRLFRFKDGESGRLHSGFVAQEVDEAAVETGIPNKDLAFLCIDENGDYGLRYEELIAIQTKVIQELLERVDGLEKKVGDLEKIIKGGKG